MTEFSYRKSFLKKPRDRPERVASLYVHVPVCRSRCRYCDFCSTAYRADLAEGVISATLAELSRRRGVLDVPLETAFIGGGTPTVLSPADLRRLLSAVGSCCGPATEFTIEANPDSLTDSAVGVLAEAGVNRVSIGVQSFSESILKTLGRAHTSRQAARAIRRAAAAAPSVSLDLMYGIPGQSMASWAQSLQAAIDSGVGHMSCYCLTFEPGTPLADDLADGRVSEPPVQLQRECYYHAIDTLNAAGLTQYEISNFARPHQACRHNLTYWHNAPYLGVGPSAVSYVDGARTANTADLPDYIERIAAGQPAAVSSERLTGKRLMAETLMLGLRLSRGVDRRQFARRFGPDPVAAFAGPIRRHVAGGALKLSPARLALSAEALFVSDSILADILADAGPTEAPQPLC